MDIVLYPRASASGSIKIWVGVFQCSSKPTLQWSVNNVAMNPRALREITSARSGIFLPKDEQRAFTGLYQFNNQEQDLNLDPSRPTLVRVEAIADGNRVSKEIAVRPLPDKLPGGFNEWFNILLVSCFHRAEDPSGMAGRLVSQLKAGDKPHLTLLLGDQVYLDLPTYHNFNPNPVALAKKFEEDYRRNWQDSPGFRDLLAVAPSISVPDDHEYWNNCPHSATVIPITWGKELRADWKKAADAMYLAFQFIHPGNLGDALSLDIAPISIFLADTRSQRAEDRSQLMTRQAHEQLKAWVKKVIEKKWYGIIVTGQSLLSGPTQDLAGKLVDYELANYQDYPEIVSQLGKLIDNGRPVIAITGDVHWGRITRVLDIRTSRSSLFEIISSPSSLVSTIGVDHLKRLGNAIKSILGKSDPWPRHSDTQPPPSFFATDQFGNRFPCHQVHQQKGNHVALLSLKNIVNNSGSSNGLTLRVKYFPIHQDNIINRPVSVAEFQLPHTI